MTVVWEMDVMEDGGGALDEEDALPLEEEEETAAPASELPLLVEPEEPAPDETEDGPELGPVSADSLSPISNAPVPRPSRDEPALDRET